ncbi:MAG: protein-disulfide reductase DsbD family protein [Akkermansiaceae bacterium]
MKHFITLYFLLLSALSIAQAQSNPFLDKASNIGTNLPKTQAATFSEVSSTASGETFTLAISIEHAEGWHAYYKNTGGPGIPLSLDWDLPEGYELVKLHWPVPSQYSNSGTAFYVYHGEYTLLADISTPTSAQPGDTATITVTPTWQICSDTGCDPPASQVLSIDVPVGNQLEKTADLEDQFASARSKLPLANDLFNVTSEIFDSLIVFTIESTSEISGSLDTAHFIDNTGVIDAQTPQIIVDLPLYYTLTATLKDGAKLGSTIDGVLLSEDGAYSISAPTNGEPAATASTTPEIHSANVAIPTSADIEAAAKLYDPNEKIDFVLLDGTKEKEHNIWSALLFIFIGGFLLNLMPCVFPVLGIKVMGFVQQAGSDARKIKLHGLAFMAGLVVSMWVLAAIIYILIFAFGKDINWGQQLTSPTFLAFMILLLFLFGLNMAGVFEVGTSLTGAGGELQQKKGYSGSFFSGVLTTLIATPCSGPFLGSVLGYTLKQPPLQGMIIFTVFALGISVPYVVLSYFPKLINKLPRPGGWMVTFKQIMAFALFASAAYFFQSFAKITGTTGASWFVMGLVIFSIAAWAFGKYGTPYTPKMKKYIWGMGFPLLVAFGAFNITKAASEQRAPESAITESSWYPGVVEQNRAKKRIVWVDYTADW